MLTAAHLFITELCYLISDSVSRSSRMDFTVTLGTRDSAPQTSLADPLSNCFLS